MKERTALDCFLQLRSNPDAGPAEMTAQLAAELLTEGHSVLLQKAAARFDRFCREQNLIPPDTHARAYRVGSLSADCDCLSACDAALILALLRDYLRSGKVCAGNPFGKRQTPPQNLIRSLSCIYAQIDILLVQKRRALLAAQKPQASAEQTLAGMRQTLQQMNRKLGEVEEALSGEAAEAACGAFLQLYNLIADCREAAEGEFQETQNEAHQIAADNMGEFLCMIEEQLPALGVTVQRSEPGTAFVPGTQEAVCPPADFDPRRAAAAESLRCGFLLGTRVLQKERVLLAGAADNH